jgi:hypothetical protein
VDGRQPVVEVQVEAWVEYWQQVSLLGGHTAAEVTREWLWWWVVVKLTAEVGSLGLARGLG